jgi:hypothetical protein
MCTHQLTEKELTDAIYYVCDLEYNYRNVHNFWKEDISYSCNSCDDKWLRLGELFCCPKCKKHICLKCIHKIHGATFLPPS